MNMEQDRKNDVDTILSSTCQKKVVVAGPGTGKSYLFQEAIKNKMREIEQRGGQPTAKDFLAITFIGKLCDGLSSDLAGLAKTITLHGHAREIVLNNGWGYYPGVERVIKSDLDIVGVGNQDVDGDEYRKRTEYYKCVGHNDVIYYALQILENDKSQIPQYELVLVDEFQDFNELEGQYIDLLAEKNEILVVGDDDQALYEFKGASVRLIRDKYADDEFEEHTLKYCSRCTEVIINAFHSTVDHFESKGKLTGRIKDKKYICYTPGKKKDSELNPKILLLSGVGSNAVAGEVRRELESISGTQRIESVLIIGEARTCKEILSSTAKKLKDMGFKNVNHLENNKNFFKLKSHVSMGYELIYSNPGELLGWRLLLEEMEFDEKRRIILDNYDDADGFINALPAEFVKEHTKIAKTFNKLVNGSESQRSQIADSSIKKLLGILDEENKNDTGHEEAQKKNYRNQFIDQLIDENKYLQRPLADLEITVCSLLKSKGLGADVVFLVGFDQGKFPAKDEAEDSEICQMLVALTRAKKRIYLVNTRENKVSSFKDCISDYVG